MSEEEPLFVLGSPRSGTTLFRLMLTCHPEVHIPPEGGFAVYLAPRFTDWTAADVPRFVTEVCATRKFETWGLAPADLHAALAADPPASYAEACARVYRLHAARAGKSPQRWGDKNNFYIRHIPEILALWPNAWLVHIVRDGRDVASSWLDLARDQHAGPYAPRLPAEVDGIATRWRDDVDTIEAALQESPRSARIRFEDLVNDPPAALAALTAAVDLSYSPDMLTYWQRNREQVLEPPATMGWKARTLDPPSTSRAGRWRTALSADQVARFEAIAGPALDRYGYRESV